jgi:hypothetical protein
LRRLVCEQVGRPCLSAAGSAVQSSFPHFSDFGCRCRARVAQRDRTARQDRQVTTRLQPAEQRCGTGMAKRHTDSATRTAIRGQRHEDRQAASRPHPIREPEPPSRVESDMEPGYGTRDTGQASRISPAMGGRAAIASIETGQASRVSPVRNSQTRVPITAGQRYGTGTWEQDVGPGRGTRTWDQDIGQASRISPAMVRQAATANESQSRKTCRGIEPTNAEMSVHDHPP